MSATSAPWSCASMAARIPAQPAPTTSTSCVASTRKEAIGCHPGSASLHSSAGTMAAVTNEIGPRFRINQSLDQGEEPPKALFLARVLDGGLREVRKDHWATSERSLEHLGRPLMRSVAHGGQLVLWHGEAGTGKTFALRALAWEWREWCQLHYIVDPDTFFGERADYLMSVLTQPEGMTMGIHMMGGGWTSYASRAIFHEASELVEEDDDEDEDGAVRGPAK